MKFNTDALVGINLRHSNITAEQIASFKIIKDCSLPRGLDFTKCLNVKWEELMKIDFRYSKIEAKQLLVANKIIDCKLPEGMDFNMSSLKNKDISSSDFSKSNISLKQLLSTKSFSNCELPTKMDFTGYSICGLEDNKIKISPLFKYEIYNHLRNFNSSNLAGQRFKKDLFFNKTFAGRGKLDFFRRRDVLLLLESLGAKIINNRVESNIDYFIYENTLENIYKPTSEKTRALSETEFIAMLEDSLI